MKAHELARKLLEGPDENVYFLYEDDYGEEQGEVEAIWVDVSGDISLSDHQPLDPPTPEEIEERKKRKEKDAERLRIWQAETAERERVRYEKWGHLLP